MGRRRQGALVALAAAALASAGCAPVATLTPYNPSDGVRVELGDGIAATNLMVVTAEQGAPGLVLGGISNSGTEDAQVTLAAGDLALVVDVGAHSTVLLDPDSGEELILEVVTVTPGSTLPMTMSTPEAGSATASIPVLDGTIPPYEDYLPEPAPTEPTATPTETATDEPTEDATDEFDGSGADEDSGTEAPTDDATG